MMAETQESRSQDQSHVGIRLDKKLVKMVPYMQISTHHPLMNRLRQDGDSVNLDDFHKCSHKGYDYGELFKTLPLPMVKKIQLRNTTAVLKKERSFLDILDQKLDTISKSFSCNPLVYEKHRDIAKYGASVAYYFYFLLNHWLWSTFFLLFLVVVFVPISLIESIHYDPTENMTISFNVSENCSQIYEDSLDNSRDSLFLQYITGTGPIRKTGLFYGGFALGRRTLLLVLYAVYLLMSLIFQLILTALDNFKNLRNKHKAYPFCQLVFYGMDSDSKINQKSFVRNIRAELKEHARLDELRKMTFWKKRKIIRIVARVLVMIIMVSSAVGIFYVVKYSRKFENEEYSNAYHFFLSYIPAITMLFLNTLIPLLIEYLATKLYFSPAKELQYVISRTIVLRIAFLVVLLFSLIYEVLDCPLDKQTCGSCIDCWENYIGGEFFKLSVVDFLSTFISVVVVTELRRRLANVFKKRYNEAKSQSCISQLFKALEEFSQPKFSIRVDILDVVYSQTICWIGFLFFPGIILLQFVYQLVIYPIKWYKMRSTYIIPKRNDHVNEVRFIATSSMLLSVFVCCVTFLYIITRMPPSKGCGEFRYYRRSDYHMISSIYEEIDERLGSTEWRSIGQTLFKSSFILIFIILVAITYYFWVKVAGSKQMLRMLDNRLDTIRKDKVFMQEKIQEITFVDRLEQEIVTLNKAEKKRLRVQYPKVGSQGMFRILDAYIQGKISKEELFSMTATSG